MEALLAIRAILEIIRLGAAVGLDVNSALKDLGQRIADKGDAFGRDDVLYFKGLADAAGVDSQAAIDEVYGPA